MERQLLHPPVQLVGEPDERAVGLLRPPGHMADPAVPGQLHVVLVDVPRVLPESLSEPQPASVLRSRTTAQTVGMDRSPRSLIMLRHAKSDWSGDEVDLLRPLAARGRRQAPEAGRWLAANVGPVDLALISPAARARETWQLTSTELAPSPPALVDDRIYAASAAELLELVQGLSEESDTVLVVGHNPGIEDLVSTLAGRQVAMPTAGLAVIGVSGPWATTGPRSATLRASGRPPTHESP